MKPVIVGLAIVVISQPTPTPRPGEMTPADRALIVSRLPRLAIDRFAALPPSVREAFTQMNCQVPQNTQAGAPANVIQGEFADKGQRDWAALCSNGTFSEIRIVWGGNARCEDRIATTQDSDTLVATAPSVFAYSRRIATASASQVQRVLTRYRASLPEEPEHDAIDDTVERVGTTRYCTRGQWLSVP